MMRILELRNREDISEYDCQTGGTGAGHTHLSSRLLRLLDHSHCQLPVCHGPHAGSLLLISAAGSRKQQLLLGAQRASLSHSLSGSPQASHLPAMGPMQEASSSPLLGSGSSSSAPRFPLACSDLSSSPMASHLCAVDLWGGLLVSTAKPRKQQPLSGAQLTLLSPSLERPWLSPARHLRAMGPVSGASSSSPLLGPGSISCCGPHTGGLLLPITEPGKHQLLLGAQFALLFSSLQRPQRLSPGQQPACCEPRVGPSSSFSPPLGLGSSLHRCHACFFLHQPAGCLPWPYGEGKETPVGLLAGG
ncbi:UNVERIFIED_CONTAM: hypothetical protein K2H54_034013 [Gekko kuhli]